VPEGRVFHLVVIHSQTDTALSIAEPLVRLAFFAFVIPHGGCRFAFAPRVFVLARLAVPSRWDAPEYAQTANTSASPRTTVFAAGAYRGYHISLTTLGFRFRDRVLGGHVVWENVVEAWKCKSSRAHMLHCIFVSCELASEGTSSATAAWQCGKGRTRPQCSTKVFRSGRVRFESSVASCRALGSICPTASGSQRTFQQMETCFFGHHLSVGGVLLSQPSGCEDPLASSTLKGSIALSFRSCSIRSPLCDLRSRTVWIGSSVSFPRGLKTG